MKFVRNPIRCNRCDRAMHKDGLCWTHYKRNLVTIEKRKEREKRIKEQSPKIDEWIKTAKPFDVY